MANMTKNNMKELVSLFYESALKAFSFLDDGTPFGNGTLHLDVYAGARVVFSAKNLAIECVLDIKDDDVGCNIVRVVDGIVASGGYFDSHGQIVRQLLSALAARRDAKWNPLYSKKTRRPIAERIPIELDHYAKLLQAWCPDILADSPDALTYAGPPNSVGKPTV